MYVQLLLLLGLLHRVEKGQSAGRMYLDSGNNLGNAEINGCSMFLKHISEFQNMY